MLLASASDDGEVIGMSLAQYTKRDSLLVEVSTDTITMSVRIRAHHEKLSDGMLVLLVRVPDGDAVRESPGGSYVRVGASKRVPGGDERLRLARRRSRARLPWFDWQTVPGTGFRSLEEALWRPRLGAEGGVEPEASLRKLALLDDDRAGGLRAKVAGVLLCTHNPEPWLPNVCITAT